jgi:L-cysteine/cystine lyase
LKNLNSKTKILIISHILWNFGYKIPLKQISIELKNNRENSYLLVDGAQTFGHINIEEEVFYSDLYSITSHKWACGPEGLGAIYVSDKFIHETDPTIIGWKSLKKEQGIYEPSDNLFHDDARKFEVATSCIPLLAGLRNSLDLLDKDCNEIEKRKNIKRLSEKLWDELNQLNGVELVLEKKYLYGIVSFNIENIEDKDKFVKKLGEKKIWIRVLEDPKWFRACVHQMTTEAEIDVLSQEIKKILN